MLPRHSVSPCMQLMPSSSSILGKRDVSQTRHGGQVCGVGCLVDAENRAVEGCRDNG